ncbi:MAG: class I SAM-dependent methyltransferase [Anaerolineae bacterium]|nr:class I SAM-dependent methyltransferase [Anaerolineae bacterium]
MLETPTELSLLRRTDDPRYYLSAESALLNYIRIADEIAHLAPSGSHLLDWGCGQGQMSFLLQRRGLQVTSYDVGATESIGPSRLYPEITVRVGTHPIALPYDPASFDAVLSCGVLEHVPYPAASLAEIGRVLRPGGQFFIYNLPQRWSWPETLRDLLRMGATHRRRFTLGDVEDLLQGADFDLRRARRTNMLPKHLSGLPPALREGYGRLAPVNLWLDRRLAATPWLNQIAGLLEIVAVKR